MDRPYTVLDAGHGGTDPGASAHGVAEKTIALAVTLKLRSYLETSGFRCTLTRSQDETIVLGERMRRAKAVDPDLLISVHLNADPDDDSPGKPEATGAEIWWFKPEDEELAQWVGRGIQRIYPAEPWRGTKRGSLYMVREAPCPAVLVELGFIDASESRRRLGNPLEQDEAALAIYHGILRRQQVVEQGTDFE